MSENQEEPAPSNSVASPGDIDLETEVEDIIKNDAASTENHDPAKMYFWYQCGRLVKALADRLLPRVIDRITK